MSLLQAAFCCCGCKCSTCSPTPPSSLSVAFHDLKFKAGGDSCIETSPTITVSKCTCVDTVYESGNECEDTATAKYVGYAGWSQIGSASHTPATGCCLDQQNPPGYTRSCTYNYRYYLAIRLIWYCCQCDVDDRGYWKLEAKLLYATEIVWPAECDDPSPHGVCTAPVDWTSIEGQLDTDFGCSGDFSHVGLDCIGRITTVIGMGCTNGKIPSGSYSRSCPQTVCDATGTYIATSGSVVVS